MLKGCEKQFRPEHWRERYCSKACREAAREWSRVGARERYRKKERARQQRQAQSKRYRKRQSRRGAKPSIERGKRPREGDHKEAPGVGDLCARPGCYERFEPTRRSPLQRFCSNACRRAVVRVLDRERRWQERGGRNRSDVHRGPPPEW